MDNNEEIKSIKHAINELSARMDELKNEVKHIKNYLDIYGIQDQNIPATTNYQEISTKEEASYGKEITQETTQNQAIADSAPQTIEPPKKQNVEFAIGSTWFNRIGIILMILGIGFFLKYSFDNHWIGVVGRIALGYIASIAFLIAGEWLSRKEKYLKFALGFTGGGITVVYLTTFAAIHFYHLLQPLVGFSILIFAAVTGAVLSVKYNAYPIAILSTLGGFVTPIILEVEGSFITLLSYIMVLNIGVLVLAYYKNWQSLNIICLIGTALYSIAALSDVHYNNIGYMNSYLYELFLLAFFIIFNALTFIYNIKNKKATGKRDVIVIIINSLVFYLISYNELEHIPAMIPWMGFFTAAIAFYYLLTYMIIQKQDWGDKLLRLTMLTTGLTFLTIALPVQMDGYSVSMSWIVEGAMIVYIGFRLQNSFYRIAGNLLLFITTVVIFFDFMRFDTDRVPFINIQSLTQLLGIIAIFAVSRMYARYGKDLAIQDKANGIDINVSNILLVGVNLFLLFYLALETRLTTEYFHLPVYIDIMQLIMIGIVSIIISAIAFTQNNSYLRYFNLLVLICLILLVLFKSFSYGIYDPYYMRESATGIYLSYPIFNQMSLAYLIVIGMIIMFITMQTRYNSSSTEVETKLHIPIIIIGNVFVLFYLLFETYRTCSYFHITEISKFAVSLVWLIDAVVALWYGIAKSKRYIRIMAQVFIAVIILKVLFYDLSQLEMIYKIMLLILVGGVLVGISFLYQRFIQKNENKQ